VNQEKMKPIKLICTVCGESLTLEESVEHLDGLAHPSCRNPKLISAYAIEKGKNKKLHREWYKAIYAGYCESCSQSSYGIPCIQIKQAGVLFSEPVISNLESCPNREAIIKDMGEVKASD